MSIGEKLYQYQNNINAGKNNNPFSGYFVSLLGGSNEITEVKLLGRSCLSACYMLRNLSVCPYA